VFCANDLLALGVLQEMTQRGIRVPADIAIVGYDDIEFAAAAAVPLSSVRQPREQLGRTPPSCYWRRSRTGRRTSTATSCSSRNWWSASPATAPPHAHPPR
jgi:LacI family transcriptional regulator